MTDPLAAALLAKLDDQALDDLAERLAPRLADRLAGLTGGRPDTTARMDAHAAAAYLGLSVDALHKLTAARTVPFEQDGRGSKLWFSRAALDDWRDCRRRGRAA